MQRTEQNQPNPSLAYKEEKRFIEFPPSYSLNLTQDGMQRLWQSN